MVPHLQQMPARTQHAGFALVSATKSAASASWFAAGLAGTASGAAWLTVTADLSNADTPNTSNYNGIAVGAGSALERDARCIGVLCKG